VSIVEIKLSHRNLDPPGRKRGGGFGSCSGDKGFPSLPAVVELFVRTTQSAEVRVSRSEVRG